MRASVRTWLFRGAPPRNLPYYDARFLFMLMSGVLRTPDTPDFPRAVPPHEIGAGVRTLPGSIRVRRSGFSFWSCRHKPNSRWAGESVSGPKSPGKSVPAATLAQGLRRNGFPPNFRPGTDSPGDQNCVCSLTFDKYDSEIPSQQPVEILSQHHPDQEIRLQSWSPDSEIGGHLNRGTAWDVFPSNVYFPRT